MNAQTLNGPVANGADRPRLKIAIGGYGHTRAIKNGSIPMKTLPSVILMPPTAVGSELG